MADYRDPAVEESQHTSVQLRKANHWQGRVSQHCPSLENGMFGLKPVEIDCSVDSITIANGGIGVEPIEIKPQGFEIAPAEFDEKAMGIPVFNERNGPILFSFMRIDRKRQRSCASDFAKIS
ncbi:hypothetical protein [Paucimonas lemoignei]|uniref:hypothetical protein n=1 Tax=Paucimonas lemoignei TaxID=29443 RepID=UPI001046CE73|nr:hypothetical protein [Paucimonas lemoignei]